MGLCSCRAPSIVDGTVAGMDPRVRERWLSVLSEGGLKMPEEARAALSPLPEARMVAIRTTVGGPSRFVA